MADLDPDNPRLDVELEAIRARADYVADGEAGAQHLVRQIVAEDVPALLWLVARLRGRLRRGDGSGT